MYAADTLSRLCIKGQNSTTDNEVEIFEDGGVSSITVSDRKQKEISQHTSTDTVMQLLINTIMNGWPEDRHLCREELKLFWNYRGSVLFNDTLKTFYLLLYGIGHMVKDHSDSKRGNLLPPHWLLFPISSKGSFICTIP